MENLCQFRTRLKSFGTKGIVETLIDAARFEFSARFPHLCRRRFDHSSNIFPRIAAHLPHADLLNLPRLACETIKMVNRKQVRGDRNILGKLVLSREFKQTRHAPAFVGPRKLELIF